MNTKNLIKVTILCIVLLFNFGNFPIASAEGDIGGPGGEIPGLALSSQSLAPKITEYGKISLTLDGFGSTGSSGKIYTQKPAGATVRKAFLAAATTGFTQAKLSNTSIMLAGTYVTWSVEIPNSISSFNYWADVTSIVKPILDPLGPSSVGLDIVENGTYNIDGEILAIIYNDPNQIADNTISLLFGAQNVNGDSFSLTLSKPIDLTTPGFKLDLSLGISYGCQGSCGSGPVQYSQINVNGKRLSTSAGGQDDGELANGALITVGGLGDTNTNPSDPGALPVDPRSDDELYNLIPFVKNGDKTIVVDTLNPSDDDNIYFAAFFFASTQADVITPFLDLPVNYSNSYFSIAALGSNNGVAPGRVNSWFDHEHPTYGLDGYLKSWTGNKVADPANVQCIYGSNCYDGHNGTDYIKAARYTSEGAVAAADGTVIAVNSNWPKQSCVMGKGYGNCVMLSHPGTRFATLYGHFDVIATGITTGTLVLDRQILGAIGNTGNSTGPHLHFGVYYDKNNDGKWTENEVVDPYGWDQSKGADPWSVTSAYLWKHKLVYQCYVGQSGSTFSSASGLATVSIPAGALSSDVNIELWDSPPPAVPSSNHMSTGNSFLLRVLEWLNPAGSTLSEPETGYFNNPVSLTIDYSSAMLNHLDTQRLALRYWDDAQKQWVSLPTQIDTANQIVSSSTTQAGYFDLQAPLICSDDGNEPNDTYDSAGKIIFGKTYANRFDIEPDEDWYWFQAVTGGLYTITTQNLASGTDTKLELLQNDAATVILSDDNGGGGKASRISWYAPTAGIYLIRVSRVSGSGYGCSNSFDLQVKQTVFTYLPVIKR